MPRENMFGSIGFARHETSRNFFLKLNLDPSTIAICYGQKVNRDRWQHS
jgi:hypothetical protein